MCRLTRVSTRLSDVSTVGRFYGIGVACGTVLCGSRAAHGSAAPAHPARPTAETIRIVRSGDTTRPTTVDRPNAHQHRHWQRHRHRHRHRHPGPDLRPTNYRPRHHDGDRRCRIVCIPSLQSSHVHAPCGYAQGVLHMVCCASVLHMLCCASVLHMLCGLCEEHSESEGRFVVPKPNPCPIAA